MAKIGWSAVAVSVAVSVTLVAVVAKQHSQINELQRQVGALSTTPALVKQLQAGQSLMATTLAHVRGAEFQQQDLNKTLGGEIKRLNAKVGTRGSSASSVTVNLPELTSLENRVTVLERCITELGSGMQPIGPYC